MLADSETKLLYSSNELANLLNVTPLEITKFIEVKNFPRTVIGYECYVEQDNLSSFFDEFYASRNIFPKYYEIPEYLKECSLPWAITLVKMYQEKFARPACLSPDQGKFLKDLLLRVRPNNVLEIGCYIGISTIWLASGLEKLHEDGNIYSVDLFKDIIPSFPDRYGGYLANPLEYAQKSVISAQLSHRVKFYKMDSRTMGKQFNQIINKPIEFLFIDGDHSIFGCLNDFILFYDYVPIGGYIILHDIYPKFCGCKGPRYVIDKYIKHSSDFDLVEVNTTPNNYGIAVIRKLRDNKRLYSKAHPELVTRDIMDRVKRAIWPVIKGKPLGNSVRTLVKEFW